MTPTEKLLKDALDRLMRQQNELMNTLSERLNRLEQENQQLKSLLEKSLDALK